jgi:2-amino-4-hydroxy-6-hydroxymethyldihydropteridine diphosphokinase
LNVAGNNRGWVQNYPNAGMGGAVSAEKYHQAFLGLGSNIVPDQNLVRGVAYLRQYVIVSKISSVWETAPVPPPGPMYLNAAVMIQTRLTPSLLKSIILRRIEVQLGRVRTYRKNAPRTIDLDILIYDEKLMDPKVWTHAFVAVPLAELLPDYTNLITGETLRSAAERLAKVSSVRIRPEIVLHM